MRRTYSTYRQTADKPMQNYSGVQKRPFKKVRATAGGLVPYGPTRYYAPRPIGARGVTKGLDTDISVATISTNMANNDEVLPLNLIQAGTGSWNRVGRIVTMKSIRLRLKVSLDFVTSTSARARQLRYLIVYDKQPNGTLPVKSDVIQFKSQNGTETGTWNGYLSYDNMERFVILKDHTITIDIPPSRIVNSSGVPQGNTSVEKYEECYLRLNHVTNYKSESTPMTIADISTGALYVMYLSDPADTDATLSIQTSYARLRYTDQ